MTTVKWTDEEYKANYSEEWERSVEIVYWERDFQQGWYIIKFRNK